MSITAQHVPLAADAGAASLAERLGSCPAWLGNTNHNRFLLIDLRSEPELPDELLARLAHTACSAPFVDDVLVLERSYLADGRFRVFGGDCREAEFCGNGALFAVRRLGLGRPGAVVTLESRAGPHTGVVASRSECRIDFGPVSDLRGVFDGRLARALRDTGIQPLGAVSAGEPHVVLAAPAGAIEHDPDCRAMRRLGARVCDCARLAGGINVTIVVGRGPAHLAIRTYERGARRLTASCGSGAVAAAALAFPDAPPGRPIDVASPGGRHHVLRRRSRAGWWLAGDPHEIGHGTLADILDLAEVVEDDRHDQPSAREATAAPAGPLSAWADS